MIQTGANQRARAEEPSPEWPSYVLSLMLGIVGGMLGDRLTQFTDVWKDQLARIANGMEPLPNTMGDAWRMFKRLPDDWWLVVLIAFATWAAFLWVRSRSPEKPVRVFIVVLIAVYLLRFVFEGHIPWHGFDGYGVAHYTIYKIGFLIENTFIVGLAWLASVAGWYFWENRNEQMFRGAK